MRIGTNLHSLQAFNSIAINNKRIQKTNQRMSSGFKISNAGDDPSALSVASALDRQIGGYEKAHQNSSHAISLIQIADGALSTIHDMTQRMRELAVQAANDSNTEEDRLKIQEEITQLLKEVDETIQKADYNGIRILSGDASALEYKYINSDALTKTTLKLGQANLGALPNPELKGDIIFTVKDLATGAEFPATVTITGTETSYDDILNRIDIISPGVCKLTADKKAIEVADAYAGQNYKLSITGEDFLLNALGLTPYSGAEYQRGLDVGYNLITRPQDIGSPLSDEAILVPSTSPGGTHEIRDNRIDTGYVFTSIVSPNSPRDNETYKLREISTKPFVIQISAQQSIEMDISIPKISTSILSLDKVNLSSHGFASQALSILDKAISDISEIRSTVGSYQNRLEFTLDSLSIGKDVLSTAMSRYIDTDMAVEMTEYTRQSVTIQAAISVMAQANQRPSEILSLLRK